MKSLKVGLLSTLFLAGALGGCDCGNEQVENKDAGPAGDANVTTDTGVIDVVGIDVVGTDLVGADLVGVDVEGTDAAMGDAAIPDAARPDLEGTDTTGVDLTPPSDAAIPDAARPDYEGVDTSGIDLAVPDAAQPDTAPPTLTITGLYPAAGWRGHDVEVALVGTGILAGAQVTFAHRTLSGDPGGTEVISDGTVNGTGTALVVTFPALDPINARPQGAYDVTVENPAGSPAPVSAVAPLPYTVTVIGPPTVTEVTPTSAYGGTSTDNTLSDRSISIRGTGFVSVPNVTWININNPNLNFRATSVSYLSDTQIMAVVPSESQAMAPGYYHVFVENPDGQGAYWITDVGYEVDAGTMYRTERGKFEITTIPPPIISAIDPGRPRSGELSDPGTLHVVGTGFDPTDAVVQVLTPNFMGGDPIPCPNLIDHGMNGMPKLASPPDPDSDTELWRDLSVAAAQCGLGSGSVAPVRVTNPDLQFDTYFSMTVTSNAEGKLSAFCPYVEFDRGVCPGNGTEMHLTEARARHDSAIGFDDLANAYIYVMGGESQTEDYLDSVEAAAVTPFGQPGVFAGLTQTDPAGSGERTANTLRIARKNHAVIAVQNYLYVIGGTVDSGGPAITGTVERARVLGLESVPGVIGASYKDDQGLLPAGTWYYRVAAVSPVGEGLASREVIARTAMEGRVELTFEAFPDAMFYMIYRSLAADGRAQSSRFVGTLTPSGGSFELFVDDGVGDLAPAPGYLSAAGATGSGSIAAGLYGYRVAALVPDGTGGTQWTQAGYQVVVEVEGGQDSVELSWDAVPGATEYALFRTEAGEDANGPTFEVDTGVITGTSFTDTGFALTATEAADRQLPIPRGSLSRFVVLPIELDTPREGLEALPLDVPVANPGPDEPSFRSYIFVIAGRSDRSGAGAYEATTERTEVALRADTAAPPTYGAGDLLGFEYQYIVPGSSASGLLELDTGRAFFALVTNAGSHSDVVPPDIVDPCAIPDRDGDGYRRIECGGTDCNDDDPNINPGATDVCEDGIDQDCDGIDAPCQGGPCDTAAQRDVDGDGHDRPECGGDDCDDSDPNRFPGNLEICDDGVDQNCDGVDPPCSGPCDTPEQRDTDGDGHDSIVCGGDDCDDQNPNRYPGNTEICDDGIDQDCDGIDLPCEGDPCDEPGERDFDRDGYDNIPCGGTDCNDFNPNINPGIFESTDPADGLCENGIDEDCDGIDAPCDSGPCDTPEQRDQDDDGYDSIACGGTDCDDTNPNINPGIDELPWPAAGMCDNGIDENCDGVDVRCIQGFTAPPPFDQTLVENNEQVFISVLYGSKAWDGSCEEQVDEQGAEHTFETSFVSGAGDLMGWTFNEQPSGTYAGVHGLEALLYYNFIYVFPGIKSNNQIGGNIDRYLTCPPGASANELSCAPEPASYDVETDLYSEKQSTSIATGYDHTFFSAERIYSRVFVMGGYSSYSCNNGTWTPTTEIEQAQQ